jgi:N-acyl-D-amino-acid deacylase
MGPPEFDLIIRGGEVFDGTGAPGRVADVAVRAGRIAEVGDLAAARGAETFDATGRAVAPGFIDVHTHTDAVGTLDARAPDVALAGIRQGVTTEVCGNCGFTLYPTLPERHELSARHTAALFGHDVPVHETLLSYREWAESLPLVANLAPLVGHGSLRAGVMGFDARPPTTDELAAMERLAEDAFEAGAFGLSSGLIYPPGIFAETSELVALAGVAARRGRLYTTHMRDESDHVDAAIEEAVSIGRASGAPVQISHHKVAGPLNWGRSEQTLAQIEAAREAGLDVMCDVYPYTAGSTSLSAVLPPWAHEGGTEAMLERLASPDQRRRLAEDIASGLDGWQDFVRPVGWESIVISNARHHRQLEGLSIAAIADKQQRPPLDTAFDLLIAERGAVLMVIHMMDDADVSRILAAPFTMIGSDGVPVPGKPHPRLAGTFARLLGRYVREQRLLGLAEAVHRMTGMPARRFRLGDRGELARGRVADLVVFDPAQIVDRSTYEDPLQPPVGVEMVVVDGRVVVRDGADSGVRAGRVLAPTS